ncbi:MAG TPA: glycoside hydrolase family 16 protein [Tenericutes bacterium]|nr:glycoside hydrolase family 16 protein [Mycoplasmatota bacterium]
MKMFEKLKYICILVILLLLYTILNRPVQKNYKINIVDEGIRKVLIDDFSNGLNEKYWNIVEKGNNYNNELQYYRQNNIFVNNGILEIEAIQEEYMDHKYTSAMINTKGKFEFLYGKVIFKAKAASGSGVVSAVWLLPSDDSNLPEIDIIEILGSDNKKAWTGIHYTDHESNKLKNFIDYTIDTDFAIYEMDWDENQIKIYENGVLRFKTEVGVPNKKMYMIINLAVGGDWAKQPVDWDLPSKLLVDYVIVIPKMSGV